MTKTLLALGSDGSTVTSAVLPYSVNLWGSHPDAGNDDCWTGGEFATLAEALACYRQIAGTAKHQLCKVCGHNWEYVEIDDPDVHEVTANPRSAHAAPTPPRVRARRSRVATRDRASGRDGVRV